MMRSS